MDWPSTDVVNQHLSGAIILASAAVGVSFLRFWRKSGDRLFLLFAVAFWIYGANRLGLSLLDVDHEYRSWLYALRFLAFLIILIGILDKNRARRSASMGPQAAPNPGVQDAHPASGDPPRDGP